MTAKKNFPTAKTSSNKPKKMIQWILLRGLAREVRHWGDFPQILKSVSARDGASARVDGIDLPGTGIYSEMRSPLTIQEITDFARAKYLELRKRQRENGDEIATESHLVATSLGGMVAASWLERWPEDFASCTLINTSFKGFSPAYRRLKPTALPFIWGAARGKTVELRERSVLALVSNRPDVRERYAASWTEIQLSRPITEENFLRQLWAASRYSATHNAVPVPTLILNSVRDRMVDPSCSEKIAREWGAEMRRHPTAGHDLPLDEPHWVAEEIASWREKRESLQIKRDHAQNKSR